MDRRVVWTATAAAVAAGIAIEVTAGAPLGGSLAALDVAVGVLLLVEGAIATVRRPASRTGWWFSASGAAWFAGTLGWPLVYLHRGPLVQLHLSYPSGRLPRSWIARIAIATAYADALILPLARDDRLTIALSCLVVVAALRTFRASAGPARRALLPALVAAIAFAGVLSLGAVLRLLGVGARVTVLWTYDLVIAAMATLLLVDLLRAAWSRAVLTGLVVDLGLRGRATLRDRLAAALGDPTAVIGTWDDARGAYLDEDGAVVRVPTAGSGRTATTIDDDGEPVALLVHASAVAADEELVGADAAAARLAVDNARLEAKIGSQTDEIAASRRRLVEVADHERQVLQRAIDDGPARRLEVVASLVAGAGDALAPAGPQLREEVRAAIDELHELADGLRPAALEEGGLAVALPALAARSALPVRVEADVPRLPDPVEAAAYFLVAEALANAAKHAGASACEVTATLTDGTLEVAVADDGAGGADPAPAGLRGLRDRVEALDGRFVVDPEPGGGTRVRAWLPGAAGVAIEPVGASPQPWPQQPSLS